MLPPCGRELDRVREQVEDDLAEAPLVAFDQVNAGRQLEREPDAVLRRRLAHHHDAALERFAQRERGDLELDLAGLDLGQVEHVVDQRQQMVAGREDVVQVLLLLGVDVAEHPLPQHLREADDRVQRRPQLVRHVRKELALVLACDLELAALPRELCQCLLQLPRTFLDLLLQALNRGLQARRHPVQLVCESTQLVAAAELDPLVVGACSDAGSCRPHLSDRADETAGEQHAQSDPGGEERREQQRRPPDLPADRRERRALGLLDEHLPAEKPDGRPGAQHLLPAEVAADRRSGLRRSQRLRHLRKGQGTMRESGGVRVRDGHAFGVDRVDVSGRPPSRVA